MYPEEKIVRSRSETITNILPLLIQQREKLNKNIELLEEEKILIEQLNKVRELERNK